MKVCKSKHLILSAALISLIGCSTIKNRAYELGFTSANTENLHPDEKEYFEKNREYLNRGEVSKWLAEANRANRDLIKHQAKFDELISQRKEVVKLQKIAEQKEIEKKKSFLQKRKEVAKGETPSDYCLAKSNTEDIYPDKHLGDALAVIDYKASESKSNYVEIISKIGDGRRVKFYNCPEYASDMKKAKKICLSNSQENEMACLVVEKWIRKEKRISLSDVFDNRAEVLSFNKTLCKSHPDPKNREEHCDGVIVNTAKIDCEKSVDGKVCLKYITKLKYEVGYKHSIMIAEMACIKGNQSGCQMMNSLKMEKGNDDQIRMQEIAESNRQRDENNRQFQEGMRRANEQMSSAFAPRAPAQQNNNYQAPQPLFQQKKTKCVSKKDFYGNLQTECTESY